MKDNLTSSGSHCLGMFGHVPQISILIFVCLLIKQNLATMPPLNIAIGVVGSFPTTDQVALQLNGPAFQVGVEELQKRYGPEFNFTLTFIYDRKMDCEAVYDYVEDWTANWYYQRRSSDVTAFIQPGCIGKAFPSLAAEWNTLVMNCVAGNIDAFVGVVKRKFSNSTLLSTGYVNIPAFADVYLNLMRFYSWETVFMLLDESSVPLYEGLFMVLAAVNGGAKNSKQRLRRVRATNTTNFEKELSEFRETSRVCFFFGHGSKLRRLMIKAQAMNMTNGQFVYVAMEVYTLPSVYGVFSWQYNDSMDQTAREAFRSLLIVQPAIPTVSSSKLVSILSEFRKRSAGYFNYSYPMENQPSQLILGCYLSVLFFGEVVVKAHRAGLSVRDGRLLNSEMCNRSLDDDFSELYPARFARPPW